VFFLPFSKTLLQPATGAAHYRNNTHTAEVNKP